MGINELQAKLKEDSALAEKFKSCKNLDDVLAVAKEAGFDISAEDLEKLTDVSAEDLSKAAGGEVIIHENPVVVIATPIAIAAPTTIASPSVVVA